jgi:hypothetical protein
VWSRAVAGVSGDPVVTANNTHGLAYRARFRGLKVRVIGVEKVIACEPVIELRRLSVRSKLFGIYWASNGQRLSHSGHDLRDGKAVAESQFVEKIEDWQEVTVPFNELLSERK